MKLWLAGDWMLMLGLPLTVAMLAMVPLAPPWHRWEGDWGAALDIVLFCPGPLLTVPAAVAAVGIKRVLQAAWLRLRRGSDVS